MQCNAMRCDALGWDVWNWDRRLDFIMDDDLYLYLHTFTHFNRFKMNQKLSWAYLCQQVEKLRQPIQSYRFGVRHGNSFKTMLEKYKSCVSSNKSFWDTFMVMKCPFILNLFKRMNCSVFIFLFMLKKIVWKFGLLRFEVDVKAIIFYTYFNYHSRPW